MSKTDDENYLVLPDSELKKILDKARKKQKLLVVIATAAFVLAVLAYGLGGWYTFMYAELSVFSYDSVSKSAQSMGFLIYIAGLIHSTVMLNDSVRAQKYAVFCFGGIYLTVIVAMLVMGAGLMITQLLYIWYIYAAQCYDIKQIKVINKLKGLPGYPFKVGMNALFADSALPRESVASYMENVGKGRVYQPDYEKILDGEIPEPEDGKSVKEDYFQQHRRI